MPELERMHTFQGSIENVFGGISAYSEYDEYIPGVTSVEILPAQKTGSSCRVRYEVNIIKSFYYVLDMYEDQPGEISWQLAESNIMKKNDGSWSLRAKKKDQTEATYRLDISFKGLVPSMITKKLTKTTLPAMFEAMQKLISNHVQ